MRKPSRKPGHRATVPLPDIAGLERRELESLLQDNGVEPYRARQLYRWIFKRGSDRFRSDDRPLEAAPGSACRALPNLDPVVVARHESADGTVKLALELDDHRRIESVFIPDSPGETFCISTQVGCAMKCAFCLTGKMGLARNLTAGRDCRPGAGARTGARPPRRPLQHRPDGDGRAAPQLRRDDEGAAHPRRREGLAVSPRRVTLSTVGVVPALERLAQEALHAEPRHLAARDHRGAARPRWCRSTGSTASRDVIDACRRFPITRRNRITFEYVMLAGVNDSPEDARRLVSAAPRHPVRR